jgi:hypothetical protein
VTDPHQYHLAYIGPAQTHKVCAVFFCQPLNASPLIIRFDRFSEAAYYELKAA